MHLHYICRMNTRHLLPLFGSILMLASCNKSENYSSGNCPDYVAIVREYANSEGKPYVIYKDGRIFERLAQDCYFKGTYFDKNFKQTNYTNDTNGLQVLTDYGFMPVFEEFRDSFNYSEFPELFTLTENDTAKFWTGISVHSPAVQTDMQEDALQACAFSDPNCAFPDNSIALTTDPQDASNTVLKFSVVPPSDSITSASIWSNKVYFERFDDLYVRFRARVSGAYPMTIASFENTYFDGKPGPRLELTSGGQLKLTNRFIVNEVFSSNVVGTIQQNEWFTVDIHIRYESTSSGEVQVSVNGGQVIYDTGITLPTSNSIQDVVRLGIIEATAAGVLFLDDLQVSHEPL